MTMSKAVPAGTHQIATSAARASTHGTLLARALAALALTCSVTACNPGTDPATLERIEALEHELRTVNREVASLRSNAEMSAKQAELPFRFRCESPLGLYVNQSEALLTCRAYRPSPEGLFPQCNVIFQKEGSVETKDYFEFVANGTPQLYAITAFEDEPTKLNGQDGFQATFETQRTPLPMKMMGTLIPYKDGIYAITCFATSASFSEYEEAFRRTISTFQLKQ